jgi:hypothetical protein
MLALNRSLLNREYILLNVLKALGSIVSKCGLHVILLSKNYTEMFYTIYKWNVPSFQGKKKCPSFLERYTYKRVPATKPWYREGGEDRQAIAHEERTQ